MISTRDYSEHPKATSEGDGFWFERELDEARKSIRKLLRQLDQERARSSEIARAYDLTVANLVAITRENAALERERDHWRANATGKPAPFKTGADEDKTPVLLRLDDLNRDGAKDLIVSVKNEEIVYLNRDGEFKPITPEERLKLAPHS